MPHRTLGIFFFYLVLTTLSRKKNLGHSGIVVWSQNHAWRFTNGEGRQNYLCGTTPTYEKRGRVSLQICIRTYRENKSCCFSNLKVKIRNPALTFFQARYILHAHVNFLSEMLPRAPNIITT